MRVALVISDADGTLVTPDKRLTEGSRRAVRRLDEAGIGFTVTSSRPSFGLRMLAAPLRLTLPIGAFNGASIVIPTLRVVEQHGIPDACARRSLELLAAFGVDAWLFTASAWLIRNPGPRYVERERRTIDADPVIVVETLQRFAGADHDDRRHGERSAHPSQERLPSPWAMRTTR